MQNVKKSLHNVCKTSVKYQKKCAFFLPNAHFADLCTLLKKCARICPPMNPGLKSGNTHIEIICLQNCVNVGNDCDIIGEIMDVIICDIIGL